MFSQSLFVYNSSYSLMIHICLWKMSPDYNLKVPKCTIQWLVEGESLQMANKLIWQFKSDIFGTVNSSIHSFYKIGRLLNCRNPFKLSIFEWNYYNTTENYTESFIMFIPSSIFYSTFRNYLYNVFQFLVYIFSTNSNTD